MATPNAQILIAAVLAITLGWLLLSAWRKDAKRSPDKVARWRALPLRYKLICWFGIAPIWLAGIVLLVVAEGWWRLLALAFWVLAIGASVLFEITCVAWYREHD